MISFSEKQKFRQWWIWPSLFAVTCFIAYGMYRQLVLKIPFGNHPATNEGLILSSFVPLFIMALLYFSHLDTEVDEKGVSYRFFPFHLRKRTIAWSEIEKAYVRKYKPILEYGGWGLRMGISGKNGALNVSGNMGLQLILKNEKRLLLGSKRPEELEQVLLQLKRKPKQ